MFSDTDSQTVESWLQTFAMCFNGLLYTLP